MKNLKVKFTAKTALEKPLHLEQEVCFLVKGIVAKTYFKPKDNEQVFVVRTFESENID
jgi:hypothetical protein